MHRRMNIVLGVLTAAALGAVAFFGFGLFASEVEEGPQPVLLRNASFPKGQLDNVENLGRTSDYDARRIQTGADAILARNIFDSEGGVSHGPEHHVSNVAENASGSLRPCQGLPFKVSTAIKGQDNSGTFVVLKTDEASSPGVYLKEGDSFGGYTIERIGWRHTVMTHGDDHGSCYLDLYGTDNSLYLATDAQPESSTGGGSGRIARR